MTDLVDLSSISLHLRRLWVGARFAYLTIIFPVVFVLAIQTGIAVVDVSVFVAGPFILLATFVVGWFVSGRTVAFGGLVASLVFLAYLLLNAVLVIDTIVPAVLDGSFFEPANVASNIIYLVTIVLVARAVVSGIALYSARIQAFDGSLRAMLRETRRQRTGVLSRLMGYRPDPLASLELLAGVAVACSAIWLVLLEQGTKPFGLDDRIPGDVYRLMMLAAFVAIMLLSELITRDAMRRARATAASRLAGDQRPPVLLLRSFKDDSVGVRATSLLALLQLRGTRLEEALARSVLRVAPFIAIGAPGEKLPPLGAYRDYAEDGSWHQVVRTWISASRLVIVVAGTTKWVQWEIRETIGAEAAARLLVILPPAPDLPLRWRRVCDCFENTPWEPAMRGVDVDRLVAVRLRAQGGLTAYCSSQRSERDYELMMRMVLWRTE